MLNFTKVFFVLISLSDISCLNFTKLSEFCLKSRISESNLQCTTEKGLQIQKIELGVKKFYCINYEKKTGNENEFDIVAFDLLHEDYDLKFVSKSLPDNM